MPASNPTPPLLNGDSTRSDPAWVVQKFGGTSVGKFAINIVDQIVLYAMAILRFCFSMLY
jgi:aspartate kinase